MVVAPRLGMSRCPIEPLKSLQEIIRVARDEVALMLMKGDLLVGTMGVMEFTWWYGEASVLTDRWHAVLPEYDSTPASALLMDEAIAIAGGAGKDFIHQGKIRLGKKGVLRMMPRIFLPESDTVTMGA